MGYDFDVIIIGAGLLGAFTARSLSRYNWKIGILEKSGDVCTGMSKANTAIVYPGYDAMPGSLKARLCVKAGASFEGLCANLGVRFRRPGSLMVSFGPRADEVLRKKHEQGLLNGVTDLRLLTGAEVIALESNINPSVRGALYAGSTATVNPWELGLAAAECAVQNGVELYLHATVDAIEARGNGYCVRAGTRDFSARAVVNCAGLQSDKVSELLCRPRLRLKKTAADYLVLDPAASAHIRHIVMHEPETTGKGATLVPTVDGNLLLGPSRIELDNGDGFETTSEGTEFLRKTASYVFPKLPLELAIRSFATARPGIVTVAVGADGRVRKTGERVRDLAIEAPAEHPGFISLIGIKTPGLTCCEKIGEYVSDMLLDYMGHPGQNGGYYPRVPRHVRMTELSFEDQAAAALARPDYARIVCRCMKVTEGEIRDAIRQSPGATTLDGIKRRTGAQMGRCQGGFCTQRILEILAEDLQIPLGEVRKDAPHSVMICGK